MTRKEAIEIVTNAIPEGICVLTHSDQSTEDYPDLTYAPLKREVGAETIVKRLEEAGMEFEREEMTAEEAIDRLGDPGGKAR